MADCLFCKIAKKEIPSKKVYEDEDLFAFEDINPKAPVHILVITKKHIKSVSDINDGDKELMGKILKTAAQIAKEKGIAGSGFRIVTNSGPDAGQSVDHLHFHLLGGRSLGWPPG